MKGGTIYLYKGYKVNIIKLIKNGIKLKDLK